MATPSSILAWRVPWTEEPGGLWSMGSQRGLSNCTTKRAELGGGHGNPLQNSYLENPMDRGTWWLQSMEQGHTSATWVVQRPRFSLSY